MTLVSFGGPFSTSMIMGGRVFGKNSFLRQLILLMDTVGKEGGQFRWISQLLMEMWMRSLRKKKTKNIQKRKEDE